MYQNPKVLPHGDLVLTRIGSLIPMRKGDKTWVLFPKSWKSDTIFTLVFAEDQAAFILSLKPMKPLLTRDVDMVPHMF